MAGSGSTPPSGQGNWGGAPGQPGQPSAAPGAPGGFQVKPVEPGPAPGIAYAELGVRIGAYLIDGLILGIAFSIVGNILGIFLWKFGIIFSLLMAVACVAGSMVYFWYCWTKLRASVGQKILGLETVNAGNGATLTQRQTLRRAAFLFAPMALAIGLSTNLYLFIHPSFTSLSSLDDATAYAQLITGSLGLGALAWLLMLAATAYEGYLLYTVSQSSKRQGFHDVQSGTVVIKRVA